MPKGRHFINLLSVFTSFQVLLHADGKDMRELRVTIEYMLELAKCDLNYDVRDRARVLMNFLSRSVGLYDLEDVKDQKELKDLTYVLAEYIFARQTKVTSESFSYRFYLPGSLSQIVLHAAPGYEPLPEPHCLVDDETGHSSNHVQGTKTMGVSVTDSEPSDIDDISGSLNEEDTSDYSSQGSDSGSQGSDSASNGEDDEESGAALIHLSDGAHVSRGHIGGSLENSSSGLTDFGELMSKKALESWLNENPGSSENSSNLAHVQRSLARISIKEIGQLVRPKSYTLLDPANGNGLSVIYRFSSEVSKISPYLVCIQVSFTNNSTEPISNILLSEEESKQFPDSSAKSVSSSERYFELKV